MQRRKLFVFLATRASALAPLSCDITVLAQTNPPAEGAAHEAMRLAQLTRHAEVQALDAYGAGQSK
jgi:hypothetical protein